MNDEKLEKDSTIDLYCHYTNDKIKLCGSVDSILELTEKREFIDSDITIFGKFGKVRFALDDIIECNLFQNGKINEKSQRVPLYLIHTDYKNNARTIIGLIWFSKIPYVFSTDNVIILENPEWNAYLIRSEKLNGMPFTEKDIMEYFNGNAIKKTSQFRIESDGTVGNTKIFFNDEQVSLIQNIKWEMSVDDIFAKVTMTVLNVPVNLKVDAERVQKIIEEYNEDTKK